MSAAVHARPATRSNEERSRRREASTPDNSEHPRPTTGHHRREDRIRAHVLLCWLALLLIRIIEHETDDTWRNIRNELQRLHLGTFTGPASGTCQQRTELTTRQRDLLRTLKLPEPARFTRLDPAPPPVPAT